MMQEKGLHDTQTGTRRPARPASYAQYRRVRYTVSNISPSDSISAVREQGNDVKHPTPFPVPLLHQHGHARTHEICTPCCISPPGCLPPGPDSHCPAAPVLQSCVGRSSSQTSVQIHQVVVVVHLIRPSRRLLSNLSLRTHGLLSPASVAVCRGCGCIGRVETRDPRVGGGALSPVPPVLHLQRYSDDVSFRAFIWVMAHLGAI